MLAIPVMAKRSDRGELSSAVGRVKGERFSRDSKEERFLGISQGACSAAMPNDGRRNAATNPLIQNG
jgi:hypothetical protein